MAWNTILKYLTLLKYAINFIFILMKNSKFNPEMNSEVQFHNT